MVRVKNERNLQDNPEYTPTKSARQKKGLGQERKRKNNSVFHLKNEFQIEILFSINHVIRFNSFNYAIFYTTKF